MKNQQKEIAEISFGVIADLQYCDADPYLNRYFRNATKKLRKSIAEFNTHDLQFIINLGDTIDRKWESFDEILPYFKSAKSMVYHVLGNHDYEVDDALKSQVPARIGTERYYDFSINPWRFIVLDGNEISTYANLEGTENFMKAEKLLARQVVNANFWNGAIGEDQLSWLDKKLAKANKNHEKVVIFCHFPIYPAHKHNLLNDSELLQILEKYNCVNAWICGHNHHGNYGMYHNLHFINLKGIVDTEHELAFGIISLTKDSLILKGHGSEVSARLKL